MNERRLLSALWLVGLAVCAAAPAEAQRPGAPVAISLADGTELRGVVVSAEADHLVIATAAGLEIKVPRATIAALESLPDLDGGATARPGDTRLMFAPTGRNLRRGAGYFSNYYVFFPGVTYGLADRFSLTAGASLFPGVGLDSQLFTLAPKVSLHRSGDFALAVGALYVNFAGEGAGGMVFAAGSKGSPDKSFTLGLGLGYIAEEGERVDLAEHPVIVFGGTLRLSERLALVSENWLITGEDLSLAEQPFGLALRFSGDDLSVDLGAIIVGEVIKEGFPIPWLSCAYRFGG